MKLKYTLKFYWGIVLVLLSFTIGFFNKIFFFIYFNNNTIRNCMVIIYILTWPMLIWGAWWAGKEFVDSVKKYFKYMFYHNSVKKGTKRVYTVTRAGAGKIKEGAKAKTDKFRSEVKTKMDKNKKRVEKKRDQIKNRLKKKKK